MSEYIDTLNINDVDYDIKDSGALHQSDVAAVATSGSYSDLSNKPKINNVELTGNKTAAQLGLQTELTIDATPTEDSTNPVQSGGVYEALEDKADKRTFEVLHIHQIPIDIASGLLVGDFVIDTSDGKRLYVVTYRNANDFWLVTSDGINLVWYSYENNQYSDNGFFDSSIVERDILELSDRLDGKQDTISDLDTIRSGAAAGATAIQSSEKGVASGVATLDSEGKVPQSQLPSYASTLEMIIPNVGDYTRTEFEAAAGITTQDFIDAVDGEYKWVNKVFPSDYMGGDVRILPILTSKSSFSPSTKHYYLYIIDKDCLWTIHHISTTSPVPIGSAAYTISSRTTEIPDISTDISTDATSDTKTTSPKAVKTFVENKGYGTYSKPSTGIPKTDLASSVQDSLDEIDGKLTAPATAGTSGQVLTSDGQGGQSWQTPTSGGITDVTVGGTSVVSGGVAVVPAIPTVPTISTDIASDATSDTKTTSPKAVKTFVENQGYGTYSKPSGGIPASDLASAVQTSLGKADTALQSFTETDPVFLASAAHGISSSDITNWNNKGTYSKPANGIPASDLASGVIPTVPTNVSAFTNDANYAKYYLCANETEYNNIQNKDSGTLYLIPES